MRILLVAPGVANVNSIPEIRMITRGHRTQVLNGNVTVQDLYAAVTNDSFDCIHFATHMEDDTSTLDEIILSDNERLDLNGATRIARMGKARLVMFNVCLAARFAAYLVKNRVPVVIYTTVAIEDRSAWELPCAFYEECKRIENEHGSMDFKAIFDSIDNGDGKYSILVGSDYVIDIVQTAILPMKDAIEHLKIQTEKLVEDVERLTASRHKLDSVDKRRIVWAIWLFAIACIVIIICGLLYMWVTLTGI